MGGPPAADFRGRPARLSHLPRRDAHRRLHHEDVGDRPDPHPSPYPRGTRHPRFRAEPAIDAGPRESEYRTRPTPAGRRPDSPMRTRPHAPRPRGDVRRARRSHRSGPTVPTGSRRPRVTRPDRRLNRPRGPPARWRSRRTPLPADREAADQSLYSSHPD